MQVKQRAIHQAVTLLQASGAQFAVLYEGQTFGNAKLAQPEPEKPLRSRGPVQFRWADVYLSFLDTCKPGDVFTHQVKTADEAASLRASLSSRMAKRYGNGSYLCTSEKELNGFTVQVLFVENLKANHVS
jgi:hypothetical protein